MPAKRCPMCHRVNEHTEWQCRACGYEFGQPIARVKELLRDQLINARIAFWLLLLVDIAVFAVPGVMIYSGSRVVLFPGFLLLLFLSRWTIKSYTKIRISRESLRSLDAQQAELPKATLRAE